MRAQTYDQRRRSRLRRIHLGQLPLLFALIIIQLYDQSTHTVISPEHLSARITTGLGNIANEVDYNRDCVYDSRVVDTEFAAVA